MLDDVEENGYNKEEKIRWIKFINAQSREERKNIAEGDELLMEYNELISEYVMDESSKAYFDEWNKEVAQSIIRDEAMDLGLKTGRIEGQTSTRKEVAKKMIKKGLDILFIQEMTGLSQKEVAQLQKYN